jgi:serine/threonine-protein kinase
VPPPPPPVAPARADDDDRPRGRRPGAALLAGLAALLVLAVVGFVLLRGGGDGQEGEPAAQATPTPTAEQTREPTATPAETPTDTPEPTQTATPEPTQTATPESSGEPNLGRASTLQVQGFNARQAGDYEQSLALSQQALQACGDAQELDPCGYALYEIGASLNALGRPDEAIPYLERRLDTYGNNGEVKAELKKAQKAAKRDGD